jgi:hypothetical protein
MRTPEEMLENKYIIPSKKGDVVFSQSTPKELANKIVSLMETRTRVILDYGNTTSNESWGEIHDVTGYIGLSGGAYNLKYPILVYNRRSIGGGSILTDCILKITASKGKEILYSLGAKKV